VATTTVADLLRGGRVERVTPDIAAAWERVAEANVHLASLSLACLPDRRMAVFVSLAEEACHRGRDIPQPGDAQGRL